MNLNDVSATWFFRVAAEISRVDLWDQWERQLASTGRPDRLAQELSDEELVNLLASKPEELAASAAEIALKQECLRRLHRAHRPDRGPVREPHPRMR